MKILSLLPLSLYCRFSFNDDVHVEFSRASQDRIIGTKDDRAHVRKIRNVLLLSVKWGKD